MIQEKYKVAHEKVKYATELLKEKGIDSWLILTREGTDPIVPLVIGTKAVHQAAIFINADGNHKILTTESDKGNFAETGLFSEVIVYHASLDKDFIDEFSKINPKKMALNISNSENLYDGLTLGQYMWLEKVLGKEKLNQVEVSSREIIKELKSIKTPTELGRIQKAIDNTIEIYDEVFSKVECGMTEHEIANLFIKGMKKRGVSSGIGGQYDPPIVCIVRAGLAHRKPGDVKTIPGDIVIMDFSVKYMGYVSDIARTMYILKPDETAPPAEILNAFNIAYGAISAVIDYISPGKKGFEVDAVGRRFVENGGYPTVRHSVGHQIGRECHDGGTLLGPRRNVPRPAVEDEVRTGEIYAIEPTVIQDDGLPCMLVEENVLITLQGAKVLSRRQTELITISGK